MANRRLNRNFSSSSSGDEDSDIHNSFKMDSVNDDPELGEYSDGSDNGALIFQDVESLRNVLRIPPECDLRLPRLGDNCHDPPLGYFTVFLKFFTSGLLFPPQTLLVELVQSLGMSFSQLTPNAVIVFSAFCHKMTEIGMPLSVELFHSLFSACRSRPDARIHFQPRTNCKFLSRIPSSKSIWRSHFFYVKDCGWGVPVVWSSGLRVIVMNEAHRALQLQCRALGLFDELFDPRSLLVNGDRLDLATIRARKTAAERHSPFAGNNRGHVDRGSHVVRDNVRRGMPSVRPEAARGAEIPLSKKATSSLSNKVSDSRYVNVEGGEARKRIPEEVRKKTGDEEIRHLKKTRVDDLGTTSKNTISKDIFVDGVNHKEKADSFWDLSDPEIGWKKGRSIVGDFDMLHLMSQSTDLFARSLAWNSCQGLSLASAMRVREEKLRHDQDKLKEEIVRLKEEVCRLTEEKKKSHVELLQVQRKVADKVKEFTILEEKHCTELKTGRQFLDSEAGKTFLKIIEDKSVQTFKSSAAFREDVLDQAMAIHDDVVLDCRQQLRKNGVSEEIVMLIEPSVLEVDKVSTDDILLGDAEMIEALIPRSVDEDAQC